MSPCALSLQLLLVCVFGSLADDLPQQHARQQDTPVSSPQVHQKLKEFDLQGIQILNQIAILKLLEQQEKFAQGEYTHRFLKLLSSKGNAVTKCIIVL